MYLWNPQVVFAASLWQRRFCVVAPRVVRWALSSGPAPSSPAEFWRRCPVLLGWALTLQLSWFNLLTSCKRMSWEHRWCHISRDSSSRSQIRLHTSRFTALYRWYPWVVPTVSKSFASPENPNAVNQTLPCKDTSGNSEVNILNNIICWTTANSLLIVLLKKRVFLCTEYFSLHYHFFFQYVLL